MNKEQFLKAIEGTKFQIDLGQNLNVNGSPMPAGVWNLLLSIRDCKLYSKGIKPHRNWKISDVKWYFGIKGGAAEMALRLEEYHEFLKS
jgi:hypothetical protein